MSMLSRAVLPTFGALLALSVLPAPAWASEGPYANLPAGGLVAKRMDAVRMSSQVLRIWINKIESDYLFDNVTGSDVTTTMTFPMPDLNVPELLEQGALDFPASGQTNFLNLRVWADGKEIVPKAEVRAFLPNGREITDDLRKLGVDPVAFDSDEAMSSPQNPTRKTLKTMGAVDDEFALWTTKINFFWPQTFPAGKRVAIGYSYEPMTGGSEFPQSRDEWCMDAGFNAAVKKINTKRAPDLAYGVWVKYLAAGANWAGPIGTFTLVIDKGESIVVSTCAIPGLKLEKKGQTFTATAKDYTSTSDINVLFVP